MEYKFELIHYYQYFDNFKEKRLAILMSILGGDPVLYDTIRFSSYGHVSFEANDKRHAYPIIEEIDKVGRGKCNCLIYDVLPNTWNNNFYDKLFIYKSDTHKYETYGYVFYNSNTGAVNHKWSIDQLDDILAQNIKKSIFSFTFKNYAPVYLKKYGKSKDCPTNREIEEIAKKFGVPHF